MKKAINKIINKILEQNMYSLVCKMLGFGFVIVGLATLILPLRYDNRFVSGLTIFFGIIIVGNGEIINILQKILDANSKKNRKK